MSKTKNHIPIQTLAKWLMENRRGSGLSLHDEERLLLHAMNTPVAESSPPASIVDDEIKLLCCPFCGSEAAFCRDDEGGEGEWINCTKCLACTAIMRPEKCDVRRLLAEKWNRRELIMTKSNPGPDAAVAKLIADLKELSDKFKLTASIGMYSSGTHLKYASTLDHAIAFVDSHAQATLEQELSDAMQWASVTFPKANAATTLEHFRREALELVQKPGDAGEIADCVLLLSHHAKHTGVDLTKAVREKMAENRNRKWGQPDAHGVVEHMKSPPPADAAQGAEEWEYWKWARRYYRLKRNDAEYLSEGKLPISVICENDIRAYGTRLTGDELATAKKLGGRP